LTFVGGISGNPGGRPKGALNKLPRKARSMDILAKSRPDIVVNVVAMALSGNTAAQRLCLERLLPAPRERPVRFRLGEVSNLKDISKESQRVMQLAAAGKLKPDEAEKLLRSLSAHLANVESSDLESLIDALEGQ
jgi:Family of unknown function (DUF5681)